MKCFNAGQTYRSENLISQQYFRKIFSFDNIARHPNDDIRITFRREDRDRQSFLTYSGPAQSSSSSSSSSEQHLTPAFSYFLSRAKDPHTAMLKLLWTQRGNHDTPIEDEEDSEDEEEPTPSGACGRISTAMGRIISDPSVLDELSVTEAQRRGEREQRQARSLLRSREDAIEFPLAHLLKELKIMNVDDTRPTKNHLHSFYLNHLKGIPLLWPERFQISHNRAQIVDGLFRMIEKNPDVFAPVSANGEVVSFNSHMVVSFRFLTVFAPFEAAS